MDAMLPLGMIQFPFLKAGWAPELVWMGAENLVPHKDSIPRPSSPQQVTILTTLPQLFTHRYLSQKKCPAFW